MPHFTIEAQGETNPLSAQAVYSTLAQASAGSGGIQGIKVATVQLSNWDTQPGYYSLLQDIYTNLSIDQSVRFQAIIQLKNGIDKHWRKASVNPIGKDEKLQIRSRAIEAGIREPASQLALQNALMIAKIVRIDFPHDWPDVITTMIVHLRDSAQRATDPRHATNTLIMTLHIVKELAAGRLQRTRKSFLQVSSELLQVLGTVYFEFVSKWTGTEEQQSKDGKQQTTLENASNSYYALKIIRRLMVVGFDHPHREKDVQQLWLILRAHHDNFWIICQDSHNGNIIQLDADFVTKHLFQLSKLYLEMARSHPASFVILPGSMEILSVSWTAIALLGKNFDTMASISENNGWTVRSEGEKDENVSPLEKLALKALLLLRACVKMAFNPAQTFKYQHPQDKEDRKIAVDTIKSSVLTDQFVISVMETLVTQYFVLRPTDLRDWQEEPDEWERREEEIADAWEFSLRSCSEKLFLDLVINFKELLVPRLLQVFYQYASDQNSNVFLKDSLYSAIGIAAACLEDTLDFNTFLRKILVADVRIVQPYYNLLRRRAAILLGQWVPIKPSSLDRKIIYEIFTHLLSKSDDLNDSVVRVTAGRHLRLVLEPFEFNFADFAPYATPIFQNLMSLISETELPETKMALLETVRVAVTKLEGHIEPYAEGIMSMLPPLWEQSGQEHLMKQAILTMITAIVTSLKQRSFSYHAAILPVIRDSVNPESEAIVYLLEDALDLWAAVLQQTPTADPPPSGELLSLYMSLIPLLEGGSESLRQALELAESYILLSPTAILTSNILFPLLAAMGILLGSLNSPRARDATLAPRVIETLIAILPLPNHFATEELQQQALRHLITSMINTGYFSKLLELLKDAYDYHQDPRPSRRPPDIIGVAETSLFSILARIALLDPAVLIEAVTAAADSNAVKWLVAEWILHFDSIGDVLRKKLHALAITNILISSSPPPEFMLEQLQSLMTIWTDVMTELGEDAPEESRGDYLWHEQQQDPSSLAWRDEAPEDGRRRSLNNKDPIYSVNVRDYVAERLRRAIEGVGGETVFEQEWLGRSDRAVVDAFIKLKLF